MNPSSAFRIHFLTTRLVRVFPLLALLVGASLPAATYYVDYQNGSDANAGTSQSTAWKRCPGDPAAAATAAAAILQAGDTVQFKGGVTYVLTGATGIALRWNGTATSPIAYDGNSAGTWGTGRARLSDNYGSEGRTAFGATASASNLSFKSFEFSGIGGAAALPADTGAPAAPRFGGGIAFAAGASNVVIDGCVFRDLGYAFNSRPMAASSLSGTAILVRQGDGITIGNCDFSRLGVGIDMSTTASLTNARIANCVFHDAVLWPLDLPAVKAFGVVVTGCSETSNGQFDRASWTGYGDSPRLATRTLAAGASLSLSASAIASPYSQFQWQKNGQPIAGATAATFSIASVATGDAGYYTVIATNDLGSAVSHETLLTVTAPPPSTDTGGSTTTPSGTLPAFTTQPQNQTVASLGTATFSVAASGSPAPAFQWFRNGVTFPGWTGATLTLAGVSDNDTGTYVAVASNTAGSVTSATATLAIGTTVTPTPTPTPEPTPAPAPAPAPVATSPAITTQPASASVLEYSSVSFTVAASGSPAPTLQWYRNGSPISGATAATFTLASVRGADAGSYSAIATNSAGTATSSAAALTVQLSVAPAITTQPASQTVAQRATVTLSVVATGTPAPTYQWYRNNVAVAGATAATLKLTDVTRSDEGTYTVAATNVAGTVRSSGAVLSVQNKSKANSVSDDGTIASSTVPATQASRLVNLSVRAAAGTADQTLIVGFVVAGTSEKSLLLRGNGPALESFGVNGALADPALALYSGSNLLAANDDWQASTEAGALPAAAAQVGAFALADGSRDAALLTQLAPGAYTGQIGAKASASGTALVELYDLDPAADTHLANVSVRTQVAANGDAPIIGFVVTGNEPKKLLIRAVGPTLGAFGIGDALADPRLEIFEGSTRVQQNDDWAGDPELAAAFTRVGAFSLADNASKDAAVIATVGPGAFTAVISGASRSSGTVLVEVYELP